MTRVNRNVCFCLCAIVGCVIAQRCAIADCFVFGTNPCPPTPANAYKCANSACTQIFFGGGYPGAPVQSMLICLSQSLEGRSTGKDMIVVIPWAPGAPSGESHVTTGSTGVYCIEASPCNYNMVCAANGMCSVTGNWSNYGSPSLHVVKAQNSVPCP